MSDEKTIFKRIIDKEIPADIVHEDDLCLAFHDVAPAAPIHVLVIPKKEVVNVAALTEQDAALACLLYTSPSPRDRQKSRMPSSA